MTDALSDATICRAAPTDMNACATIFNDWVDSTPWMPRVHAHDDVAKYYRNEVYPKQRVFVAKQASPAAQGPCGFLSLSTEGFVTALYLAPQARGRGIGKALLDTAKTERSDGLSLWAFVENTDAIRFYRREAFQERRRTEGDNEERLPDILLSWRGGAA